MIYLLLIPIVIFIFSVFIMIKNKIITKMAFKNIFRRKTDAFLMILGSMIGTAFIVGAMGLNDSFTNFMKQNINNGLGEIDEIILKGEDKFVDYKDINKFLSELKSEGMIDGILPVYDKTVTGAKKGNIKSLKIAEIKEINLIGIDIEGYEKFGSEKIKVPQILKDIKFNETVITKEVADTLGLKEGEEIEIVTDMNNAFSFLLPRKFKIKGIIYDKGLLNYRGSGIAVGSIYINKEQAKKITGASDDEYSEILISSKGNVLTGADLTDKIRSKFKKYNLSEKEIKMFDIKQQQLKSSNSNNITVIFLVLSIFSIISGCVLIINMYEMLASERKSELGVLRAIGFSKNWIKQCMYFESFFYSLFSAPLGIISGIGISYITFMQVNSFNADMKKFGFFQNFIPTGEMYTISLSSIIYGAIIGTVFPLVITYIFSSKIANLNIVNSIKDIDEEKEPKSRKLMIFLSMLIIVAIMLLIRTDYILLFGLSSIIILFPYAIKKIEQNKYVHSSTSIAVLIMIFLWPGESVWTIAVKCVLLLISFILLAINNFRIFELFLLSLLKPFKKAVPVIKIALSYPMRNNKRTNVIVILYSLVTFIIVIFKILPFIQTEALNQNRDRLFGGFDGSIIKIPISKDFDAEEIRKNPNLSVFGEIFISPAKIDEKEFPVIFASDSVFKNYKYKIIQKSPEFNKMSDKDIYDFVYKNSSYVLLPESIQNKNDKKIYKPGEIVEISLISGHQSKDMSNKVKPGIFINFTFKAKVAGIISGENRLTSDGVIASLNRSELADRKMNIYLFKLNQNKKNAYDEFQVYTRANNIFAVFVNDIIDFTENMTKGIINLFITFLYFGVFIGVLGISVITIKSVKERRKVIGMLKAIGFNKNMIFWSFFLETSFIIMIGIFIGYAAGIATSFQLYKIMFQEFKAAFLIPWDQLIIIGIVFYLISVFFTFFPSRAATKISAADAMRNYD